MILLVQSGTTVDVDGGKNRSIAQRSLFMVYYTPLSAWEVSRSCPLMNQGFTILPTSNDRSVIRLAVTSPRPDGGLFR